MKHFHALAGVLVLMLAGCGGAATDLAPPTVADSVTYSNAIQQDRPASTGIGAGAIATTNEMNDGEAKASFYGSHPGTGTVEIGEVRYEFNLSVMCLSMIGAMGVAGQALDGSDATVDADFPPPGWKDSATDWDPPSISIEDDDRQIRWQAGGVVAGTYPEGSSQIDSFTTEGRLAVGEATFVNRYTFGEGIQVESGRFEFNCPEA